MMSPCCYFNFNDNQLTNRSECSSQYVWKQEWEEFAE